MDPAPASAAELNPPELSAVPSTSRGPAGSTGRVGRRPTWLRTQALPHALALALIGCLGMVLAWVYASRMGQGLWEDGYFVKRFAYNYWHHGSFSWNVADGPVYGMTSQTLQALATLLYAISPEHVVLGLKAACCFALFATLPVLAVFSTRLTRQSSDGPSPLGAREGAVAVVPCLVGLSSAALIESAFTGLETTIGLLAVAVSMLVIFRPVLGLGSVVAVSLSVWAVYLTRPDAILIPGFLLAVRWSLAAHARFGKTPRAEGAEFGPLTASGALIALGLALMLFGFQRYYGTALPLPFYVKMRGLNAQDASYIAYFAIEKAKNVTQIAFMALPFAYVALHDRSRVVLILLATGLAFGVYHYFATIETMGYYSRFYLPGFISLIAAAAVAYRRYQQRRRLWLTLLLFVGYVGAFIWLKHVDNVNMVAIKVRAALYIPSLVVMGMLLLAPASWAAPSAAAIGLGLCIGTALNCPIDGLKFETDDAILLRQARPRTAFRGIEQVRDRLQPKVVYHTDMGAPGLIFPEAKVVDLDGLLNEDVTLRGAHFEQLCEADQPEAIYLPKGGYVQLRAEILGSACFQHYHPVTPPDGARLYIRKDLVARYRGQ
jgi:hypothetical protein